MPDATTARTAAAAEAAALGFTPAQAARHAAAAAEVTALVAEERTARAAAVGLPGITRGAEVTYTDADGATRRGTFERVAAYGRGSRVAYLMVAVRTVGGAELHVTPELVQRAAPAALPDCSDFTGDGQRCGTCRTHRRNHA